MVDFFGFGKANFGTAATDLGGAVSDLFAAEGDKAEARNYRLAADLAAKNEQYEELSTAIKNQQTERDIYQKTGALQADVASAGFAMSGSAGDLLRESVSQGALAHAVVSEQGYMQEQAYKEQQQSYLEMASAKDMAAEGADIGAGIKGVASIAAIIGL